ncbi:hypothetical protein IAR50_007358 [Cryptococcus sp. DSM 104548]
MPARLEKQDSSLKFGVASALLGLHPSHKFDQKFQELQKAGFEYCEVLTADYIGWVREQRPGLPESTCPAAWAEFSEPDPSDEAIWTALYDLARQFTTLAAEHGLKVVVLQPLNHFEGWPEGHERCEWVRRKAERWLLLCAKLGVEFLQVGGNDRKDATAGDEKTASDMRWLAELGARQDPPVKIAYECWCFGDSRGDWEYTYKIVQLADHPNLGLCLDTAQLALSPTYGWDPLTRKGWSRPEYDSMISRLSALRKEKIFYLELSDVLQPSPPLYGGSKFDEQAVKDDVGYGQGKNARGKWVFYARPVPLVGPNGGLGEGQDGEDVAKKVGESDAARVVETLKAILSTGWRGYCMFEVFESIYMGADDPGVPRRYAQACKKSKELLLYKVEDSGSHDGEAIL